MKKTNTVAALAVAATLTFGLAACDGGPSRQEIAAQEQAVEDAEKRAQEAEEAAEQAAQEAAEAQEAADAAKTEDEAAEAQESIPEPEVEDAYEFTSEDETTIVEMALDMTWDKTSASDQVDICMGWGLDEEWALDMVSDGYETEVLSMSEVREIMRDFFTEKCG